MISPGRARKHFDSGDAGSNNVNLVQMARESPDGVGWMRRVRDRSWDGKWQRHLEENSESSASLTTKRIPGKIYSRAAHFWKHAESESDRVFPPPSPSRERRPLKLTTTSPPKEVSNGTHENGNNDHEKYEEEEEEERVVMSVLPPPPPRITEETVGIPAAVKPRNPVSPTVVRRRIIVRSTPSPTAAQQTNVSIYFITSIEVLLLQQLRNWTN